MPCVHKVIVQPTIFTFQDFPICLCKLIQLFLSHEDVICKMIHSADTFSFSRRFNLWYTRNIFQVSGWAKTTSIFYHQYNLIACWLVQWIFQKCLWAFVYLQWLFRCRASKKFRHINIFLQLYESTYYSSIWFGLTCAQVNNSPIVARHKSSQQFCLVHDCKNLQIFYLMLILFCCLFLECSV